MDAPALTGITDLMNRKLRAEGRPVVNAKRVLRIMRANGFTPWAVIDSIDRFRETLVRLDSDERKNVQGAEQMFVVLFDSLAGALA